MECLVQTTSNFFREDPSLHRYTLPAAEYASFSLPLNAFTDTVVVYLSYPAPLLPTRSLLRMALTSVGIIVGHAYYFVFVRLDYSLMLLMYPLISAIHARTTRISGANFIGFFLYSRVPRGRNRLANQYPSYLGNMFPRHRRHRYWQFVVGSRFPWCPHL